MALEASLAHTRFCASVWLLLIKTFSLWLMLILEIRVGAVGARALARALYWDGATTNNGSFSNRFSTDDEGGGVRDSRCLFKSIPLATRLCLGQMLDFNILNQKDLGPLPVKNWANDIQKKLI